MSSLTVWDSLAARASETPAATAIRAPLRPNLLYRDLVAQVQHTVHCLNEFGLGRGDRIAVSLPPGPEFPVAIAAVMAGSVCVPLDPEYSVAEFAAAFSNMRAAALMTRVADVPNAVTAARQCEIPVIALHPSVQNAPGAFELHCEREAAVARNGGFSNAGDLAAILTTSGTTASPKLIPLTQAVVWHRASRARNFVDLSPSDCCLDLMPSFHGDAVLISILGCFFAGASSVFMGKPATRDFTRLVDQIQPTWCSAPPPYLERLMLDGARWAASPPPGLRAFFTCGAPVSAETVAAIERVFGIPLQNSYGASECGGVAANPMPPRPRKQSSVGVSIGLELAVFGEGGVALEPGETGEVAVRGPGVFSGYENLPASAGGTLSQDWHRTGDLGYLDHEGYLFLTGRLGESINRGGEKISPEEIEAVLRRHPAVRSAVAFPIPDKVLGQQVAAAVVLSPETSASARELRAFAARQLAAAKIPRVVVAVDEIPAGATGKVRRNRLAELFAEELESALKSPPGEYTPPRTSVERLLADIWAAILHVERVGIRDRFYDLGGNSLLAVNMLSEVERKFGRGIPAGEFWTAPTLENLAAILIAAEPKKSSVMIPVQPSGRKPPLYYVLPGWFISEVELLSRYLGDDQPVYALVPDTRPGAGQHGMGSDEIVAECVAAIEATQRGGPYFVVGRSAGGLVALEIARKLGEHGNAVGLAGLLDTHYPGVIRHRLLPTPLRQIEFLMGDLLMTPRPQWRAHLLRMPWRALRRGWRTIWRLRLPSQIANQALATGLERVFHEAPEPYPGRITFFAAESSRHRGFLDRRLYWSQAAAMGLELHLTPGDHNMMVQEPHIRRFAEALQGCLDRASGIDAAGGRSRSSTGKFATHEATSVQSSARSDTRRLR